MKISMILLLMVLSISINQAHALSSLQINIIKKENLSFSTLNFLSSKRFDEMYTNGVVAPEMKATIEDSINDTIALLPTKYVPKEITVYLEDHATIKESEVIHENVPLSVLFSVQQPKLGSIRFNTFEIITDYKSIRSIMSHEMGHMLIEWACRKEGTFPADQNVLQHLDHSIYEAIADYVAAVVTNDTIIGGKNTWFSRDILEYETVEQARNTSKSIVAETDAGLREFGLIPNFKLYNQLIPILEDAVQETGSNYPGSDGVWLAGQFWKLSQTVGKQKVFDIILKIAITGEKFNGERSVERFYESIIKNLNNDLGK